MLNFIFTGLIWSEMKQLWDLGLMGYVSDMWNIIDFITNSLYVATVALRLIAYLQVRYIRSSCWAHDPITLRWPFQMTLTMFHVVLWIQWFFIHYLSTGAKGDRAGNGHGVSTPREVGRLGSDLDCWGPLCDCQHLQFASARVHLLCESASGAPADLSWSHGDRHSQVFLRLHARSIRVCLRNEPTSLVSWLHFEWFILWYIV